MGWCNSINVTVTKVRTMSQLGFSTGFLKTTAFISAFLQLLLYLFSSLPYLLFFFFFFCGLYTLSYTQKMRSPGSSKDVDADCDCIICSVQAAVLSHQGSLEAARERTRKEKASGLDCFCVMVCHCPCCWCCLNKLRGKTETDGMCFKERSLPVPSWCLQLKNEGSLTYRLLCPMNMWL